MSEAGNIPHLEMGIFPKLKLMRRLCTKTKAMAEGGMTALGMAGALAGAMAMAGVMIIFVATTVEMAVEMDGETVVDGVTEVVFMTAPAVDVAMAVAGAGLMV